MLKCLELFGFKSFADKTRIEFDAGITAIVGPNGSGKSNVVDAIRWILGEQSAKSLRGSAMADVIFNGSGSRRSMGLAEVSLTLDNQNGFLPVDSEQVVLTRRVYRSGEGEYLINGQLARLRDIKDLFLGTGAGAGAYSIIEQGKVEALLQTSTKDRRHIFEEAAGISKFRAKKIESLRRLDRIEQNLLRVEDIHDEVDKQLRGLRTQAGKARKHKEYSDRLRELRVLLGLADYRALTSQLDGLAASLEQLSVTVADDEARLEQATARYHTVDCTLQQRQAALREVSEQMSEIREEISAIETEISGDVDRANELCSELQEGRPRLHATRIRAAELRNQRRILCERSQSDAESQAQQLQQLESFRERQHQVSSELDELRKQTDRLLDEQQANFKRLSRLENEQSALESQAELLWQQLARVIDLHNALRRRIGQLHQIDAGVRGQLQVVGRQYARAQVQVAAARKVGSSLAEQRDELHRKHSQLRDERTRIASRVEVLQSLAQRHEGLEEGAKEALRRRDAGDAVWQPVVGVLAECLEVPAELADPVELALGSLAQAFVVRSTDLITEELLAAARALPGRVRFISLEDGTRRDQFIVCSEEIDGPPLASRIQFPEEFGPLVRRLLETTFLVESYGDATVLARAAVELQFVTAAGDLVSADGSISAGPLHASGGVLARAAELRDLERQLSETEQLLSSDASRLAQLDRRIQDSDGDFRQRELQRTALEEQCRHFETQRAHNAQQIRSLEHELARSADEVARTKSEIAAVDKQGSTIDDDLHQTHATVKLISGRIQETNAKISERQQALATLEEQVSAAQLELAVMQERFAAVTQHREQIESDLRDRERDLDEQSNRVQRALDREADIRGRLLANSAALAQRYHQKETLAIRSGYHPGEDNQLRNERQACAETMDRLRASVESSRERLHREEIQQTELRLRCDSLVQRLLEDYEINLTEADDAENAVADDFDPEAARGEIKETREKIARLGSVNLQAVEELDQLEDRYGSIRHQIDDLTTARRHLEDVIGKINTESRRLFLDTFETVRGHFQEVFRNLFGGGKADLLLEDDTDVLETGIEVIARPPGKEPRSISLLSGGEKTLTATALLMALFRAKPSPFCVLDEVDAALDEANIGRFINLLREYLSMSQFLLVTHSKTTMAVADVLHGITQRESGVSTRVSVRLEDVTDDGEIIADTDATDVTYSTKNAEAG